MGMERLIEINPGVMMGKPVVRGTRITVELILERLGAGESVADLLESFPHLSTEAVLAAIRFGAEVLKNEVFLPLSPAA
jgi:uncharacterized protein (DUF433 family)